MEIQHSVEATRKIAGEGISRGQTVRWFKKRYRLKITVYRWTTSSWWKGLLLLESKKWKNRTWWKKSSTWIKGKVVSQEGSVITVDLGRRVIKVTATKIRKDHQPLEDVDIPLEPVPMYSADTTASACHADTTAVDGCTSRKETDPANKLPHADAHFFRAEGVAYGNWEPVSQVR